METLKNAYLANPTRNTIIELAIKYGVHYRGIIKALGDDYKRPKYLNNDNELPTKKEDFIKGLARSLGCEYSSLAGLNLAPKEPIKLLLKLFDPREFADLTTP